MAFRKPSHIYLWGNDGVTANLLWIAALWCATIAVLYPLLPRLRLWRLVSTGIAVGVFCTIAALAGHFWPAPLLAGLVLTRSSMVLVVALPALVAALTILAVRDWISFGGTMRLARTGLSATAGALLALPDPFQGCELLVLACIAGAGIAGLAAPLKIRWPFPFRVLDGVKVSILALSLLSVVAPIILLPGKWRGAVAAIPKDNTAEWTELTTFLRERLPRNEMVLMPPYPYSMVSSRHASPTDYGQIGFSVYAPRAVSLEFREISKLFGLELGSHTPQSITQHLASNGGILCLLEKGYVALTSDRERLIALRAGYPTLRYAVAVKAGAIADEWTCGPAATQWISLPAVFESERYVVYKLPD